jgi:hypothetical protein
MARTIADYTCGRRAGRAGTLADGAMQTPVTRNQTGSLTPTGSEE